jgi:hypothetical protein
VQRRSEKPKKANAFPRAIIDRSQAALAWIKQPPNQPRPNGSIPNNVKAAVSTRDTDILTIDNDWGTAYKAQGLGFLDGAYQNPEIYTMP